MYGTFFSTGQALIAGVSKTGQEKVFLYNLCAENGPVIEDASHIEPVFFSRCQDYGQSFDDLSFPQIEKGLKTFYSKVQVLDGLFWAPKLSSDDKLLRVVIHEFLEVMEQALYEPAMIETVVKELKIFKNQDPGSYASQDPYFGRALKALGHYDEIIKGADKSKYPQLHKLLEELREAEVA